MTFSSRNNRLAKRCRKTHLSIESLEGRRLLAITGEVGAIPLLHSFPEATTKVFLDFDGNYELSWSEHDHVVTPPYDIDGDVNSFNELEQARILETWKRVSEDYAPFNIDVTTEDPADHTTELNEVDINNKRIRTFYFRHEFQLERPADLRNLQVHLLRDDGAAVYLNGTEIVRDNLSNTARFDSFATSGSSGVNERTYHTFQVDSGLLVAGRNVISAEVHQRSDSSSDVSFDLKLDATHADESNTEIIPQHSEWRYLDDGSNQGTLWRAPDFDDSDWSLALGEFGYGDVVATTHVAIGGSWSDWFGDSAGGVAFSGGFHNTGSTTAFVFTRSIADNAKNIAEAASHEAGHTFGLAHQGLFDESTGESIDEYNPGGNGWAPIMGVSYDQDLTTWHDGPTRNANTTQDNMSILARNGGGHRADDHGDSAASGTSLLDSLDDNGFFRIDGIVEKNTDRDAFKFSIDEDQSGVSILLHGIGIESGQNLDAVIELRDSDDTLIHRVDPEHSYDASLQTPLAPGDYVLYVQSNGEYGRVGQYTLSVHVDERPSFVTNFNRVRPLSGGGFEKHIRGAIDFENDSDLFTVAGQSDQVFATIVSSESPTAILSVDSPMFVNPIVAAGPGQSVTLPPFVLNDEDTTFEISSSESGRYGIEFYVNANTEKNETLANGSSAELPSRIEGWQTDGMLRWNTVGSSGDGTDTQSVLISRGTEWRFLDDGSNQLSAWRAHDFDDADWSVGAGHFGYGDGDETVLLDETRDNESRIRTFYFRHTFHVDQPAEIRDLQLRLLRDDGAAVYLNGTEVRRDNLSSIAAYNTLANEADVENQFIESQIDASLLLDGENVLAVEVHQASDISNDVSFELELLANVTPLRPATEFIPAESSWRYLDDGSDQRVSWQKPDFADEHWQTGTGKFGYGEDDVVTQLDRNSAEGDRIRTFYFRRDFEVVDLNAVEDLVASINFDDGIAIYINGVEAVRSNLVDKANYQTLANGSKRPEGVFEEFVIDPALLDVGRNVIAVEVHQSDDTSSDVAFDLVLTGLQDATEIDAYEFEVTEEMVGREFDIGLFGDQDFANEAFALRSPDGQTLAVAQPTAGDAVLAMQDVRIESPGIYSLLIQSNIVGAYHIAISSGVWPEYRLGQNGLPELSTERPSGGYLDRSDTDDTFEFTVHAAGEYTLELAYPFNEIGRSTENDLQATIAILRDDGTLVTASNSGQLSHAFEEATYKVEILRSSGLGEYTLRALPRTEIPPTADLNDDGVVDSLDIDHLCVGVRSGDGMLDQNGDGIADFADVEMFVLTTLKSKFGDANLDGVFNSTDFVSVFERAEYEDDVVSNSIWSEGDWNCSGDFDTRDFVTAFQYAGYTAAATKNRARHDVAAHFDADKQDADVMLLAVEVKDESVDSREQSRARVLREAVVDAVFAA